MTCFAKGIPFVKDWPRLSTRHSANLQSIAPRWPSGSPFGRRNKMRWLITVLTSATLAFAQSSPALRFENAISLPDVQGRIDHMSLDVANGRLFVAALGNNTVEVIDVKRGKRIDSIRGLREPQGVYYLPGANRLY